MTVPELPVIWIVGVDLPYETWEVKCACPTREIAQAVADKFALTSRFYGKSVEIKAVPVLISPDALKHREQYQVDIDLQGQIIKQQVTMPEEPSFSEDEGWVTGSPDSVHARSFRSFDAALNAARERLAELKASGEQWP